MWLACNQAKAFAESRLICFPYAGAGASVFFPWGRALNSTQVEVHSVQLPGRETRLSERPARSVRLLAPALAEAVGPLMDRPVIFVGHSMGALIAFEVCRELRRQGLRLPRKLIVCGAKPPHLVHLTRKLHHLSDVDFIETIARDYNGIPKELLNEPQIVDLIRPILRADFELMETYNITEEPPLDLPILAFGGREDITVPWNELLQWGRHTAREFREQAFAGGHFFINETRETVIQSVLRELRAVTT